MSGEAQQMEIAVADLIDHSSAKSDVSTKSIPVTHTPPDPAKTPLYFNSSHDINVSIFPDSRPIPGVSYFRYNSSQSKTEGGLSVLVPVYNESAIALETTLDSLYETHEYMCNKIPEWRDKPFNICIVQDGWCQASQSFKKYLFKMFPKDFNDENNNNNNNNYKENENKNNEFENGNENENEFDDSLAAISKYFTDYNESRDGALTAIFEKPLNVKTYYQLRYDSHIHHSHGNTGKQEKDGKKKKNMKFKNLGNITDEKEKEAELERRSKLSRQLNITIIIKLDNRRKHNSHEWFFGESGFVDSKNDKYMWLTDCFTLFELYTLYYFINYMESHNLCIGLTGRKRVMTRRQQLVRSERHHAREWTLEPTLSFSHMLRLTQVYDCELFRIIFYPLYGALGFLPVLEGPCGFYRRNNLCETNSRNWYFNMVNAEIRQLTVRDEMNNTVRGNNNSNDNNGTTITDTGLLGGIFKSVEDRMLVYGALWMSKNKGLSKNKDNSEKGKVRNPQNEDNDNSHRKDKSTKNENKEGRVYTTFIPDGLWYFESETSLKSLLFQRRRWNNGRLSHVHFIITNWKNFWNMDDRITICQILAYFYFVCQFLLMACGFIVPFISFEVFSHSVYYFLTFVFGDDGSEADSLNEYGIIIFNIIMIISWLLWVLHVTIHNIHIYNGLVIYLLYLLSVIISISFICSFIMKLLLPLPSEIGSSFLYRMSYALNVDYLLDDTNDIGIGKSESLSFETGLAWYFIILFFILIIVPFINTLFITLSLKSVWLLMKSFLAYFVSIPMFHGFFTSYSYVRCWDFTWGNRPTVGSATGSGGAADSGANKSNSNIVSNPLAEVDEIEERYNKNQEIIQSKFSHISKIVTFFLLVINITLYVLPPWIKLLVVTFVLSLQGIFLVSSMIVILAKIPQQIILKCCQK